MIGDDLIVLLLLIGLPPGFPACQVTVDRRRQAKTAGNGEDLAGGVGGLVAGEIYDRRSDLLRQTHSPKGNMPQEQTAEFFRQVLFHRFRGGHAREHGIAPNMILCLMDGDQFGKIVDCRFACTVSNLRDIGDNAAYRGNVDNTPPAMFCHMLCSSLTCHKDASQIQINGIQKHIGVSMCKVQILAGIGCAEIID